jgi:hypothetical protein
MRILLLLALAGSQASGATPRERPVAAPWPLPPASINGLAEADRVAAQFPNSMGLQRRRLAAALEGRNAATALDAVRRLAAAGAGLSPAARAQVAALVGAEPMQAVDARFEANLAPVGRSILHATVPTVHRLIEGLVWNSSARQLYATSVVDRRMVILAPRSAPALALHQLGSVFGAAFDPIRGRVWAASAMVDETPGTEPGLSGLLSFDPADPGKAVRVPAPEGVTLGDVAVARDGIVYASDGLKGGVYRCRPGCTSLEILIRPGILFSAQGLAVSDDQRWLYVADRRYGVAAIERATGRIGQLAGGEDMMLDGIDGLVAHGTDLIATQTAYSPQRIIRLRLSPDGARVRRLEVLERANSEWGEVTLATVAGDRLLYVANAQWARFGEGGVVKGDAPLEPTAIRMLKLR